MHLFHSPSWQALSQNSPFYSFPPDVLKPSQRHLATCGWWWWWWLEGRDGEGEQKKREKSTVFAAMELDAPPSIAFISIQPDWRCDGRWILTATDTIMTFAVFYYDVLMLLLARISRQYAQHQFNGRTPCIYVQACEDCLPVHYLSVYSQCNCGLRRRLRARVRVSVCPLGFFRLLIPCFFRVPLFNSKGTDEF